MVRLTGSFSQLRPCKVLVAGDLLLDTYTIGKTRRISPEAPVVVVQVQSELSLPGGAGNVILNLRSMGAWVVPICRVGPDANGDLLLETLKEEVVDLRGIVRQNGYATPVKNRVIAENQQIVRVDYETIVPLPENLEQQIIDQLPERLKGVDVIAISDYGKGFLTKTLLTALIDLGRKRNIPIIADPKGTDFAKYKHSTVIKPNLSEAYAAANLPPDAPLEAVAPKVLQMSQSDVLMVTRSEAGISLFFKEGHRKDFPVKVKEVKDVTGAGDTVLAMLTCAMASGLSIDAAAQLSNVAAGIAIERLGCARVNLSDLARRLLESDVANKVFDEEHLYALQQALQGRRCALLGLSGKQGLSTSIFKAIHSLSNREGWDLLVFVTDPEPPQEFIEMLSALHDVDFILVNGDNLRSLCSRIQPEEVYEVREKELIRLNDALELIEAKREENASSCNK